MKLINSRFDDTNRRIDDTNKGIDDTNKGIDDTNRRIEKLFDDTNRRIDALESRQREDGAQLVALGKHVAKLVGRVDEVAGMVSAAFQTVLGIVVTRPGGKERAPSVMEQAAFTEPGAGEDSGDFLGGG